MITLHPAGPEDIEVVMQIADACGMSHTLSTENCLIAYDDSRPVGFTRLEFVSGIPYVRPIAVLPSERGRGIGKRMLSIVLAKFAEVRAVSRGTATEFYRNLGFERMSWEDVHPPYRQECNECPDKAGCKPLPMLHPSADEVV